jgi:hypothetical protein
MNILSRPDRGTRYSLLFKAWQAVAGVVTIAFIARHMDPVVQGYYYAFASLIALQSFFELGLYLVVSVSASHEWARLRLAPEGRIVGNSDALSRLVSLGRFVFKWYGAAAALFLLLAGGAGLHFFGRTGVDVAWRAPWLLHVAFAAGSLWLLPFLSLLEGCDQFESTARFRLLQSLASSAAAWAVLAGGAQLWAVPALSGVSLALLLAYLGWTRRQFLAPFHRPPAAATLSWRHDLLPMQWRLALQGLFSYLSFPLYPALVFSAVGAAEAGRLGMSLQIVSALQSLALVLLSARAPALAIAVAQRRRDAAEAQWRRASAQSLLTMLLLSLSFLAVLWLAVGSQWPVAQRVLPLGACAMLVAGSLLALAVQSAATYLRAHKRERLTPVGVIAGASYGASAWAVASSWGSWGVAASYLAVTALVALPLTAWVFATTRRNEARA